MRDLIFKFKTVPIFKGNKNNKYFLFNFTKGISEQNWLAHEIKIEFRLFLNLLKLILIHIYHIKTVIHVTK